LKKRREKRKRQYMWPDYKRYSRREDQYVLHGKRHRSTVKSKIHLQKVYSYLREDGLQGG